MPGPDPVVVAVRVAVAALSVPVNLAATFRCGVINLARQIAVAAAVAATLALIYVGVSWLLRDMHFFWMVRRYRPFLFSLPFVASFLVAWRFGRQPAWLAAICASAAAAGGWAGLLMAMDWTRHF